MQARWDQYKKLLDDIGNLTLPQGISTNKTDVFERTLLELAGVNTVPTFCRFEAWKDMSDLTISLRGLTQEDVSKFLTFLKEQGQDANARVYYHPPAKRGALYPAVYGLIFDVHKFEVNIEKIMANILPLFEKELNRMVREDAEKISEYRKQSVDGPDLIEYYKKQLDKKPTSIFSPAAVRNMAGTLFRMLAPNDDEATAASAITPPPRPDSTTPRK